MGIYIFNKSVLFDYLKKDAAKEKTDNDFGKNIIPDMLESGEKMYAYKFDGYWKDVGTISSLWEANMDLLGSKPVFDINDESWRIYSRNTAKPPQYIGEDAVTDNSLISEGCEIYGTVINSVISPGVLMEKGAVVKDSVIMGDSTVKAGSSILYSIIDENAVIGKDCSVGSDSEKAKKITVIGAGTVLPDGYTVETGKIISADEVDGGTSK